MPFIAEGLDPERLARKDSEGVASIHALAGDNPEDPFLLQDPGITVAISLLNANMVANTPRSTRVLKSNIRHKGSRPLPAMNDFDIPHEQRVHVAAALRKPSLHINTDALTRPHGLLHG